MDSIVLLTVALMRPPSKLATKHKPRPRAIASVELKLPDDQRAREVFLRIAAEFQHIARALTPEQLATTLTEGAQPDEAQHEAPVAPAVDVPLEGQPRVVGVAVEPDEDTAAPVVPPLPEG